MYGDCQVMKQSSSSMMMGVGGENMVGMSMNIPMPMSMNMSMNLSDPVLFPPNPNHLTSFMADMPPFHSFSSIIPKEEVGMMRKEEEIESGSGSGQIEGLSCGEEHDTNDRHLHQQEQQILDQQDQNPHQLLDSSGKKKRYHRHTARQIQEMEAMFKECPHPDDKQRMRLSQELGLKPRQVKFWFQNRRTQMKAQQDRSDNVILRAENESLKTENFRLQAAMPNVICPNCGSPAILGEMSLDEQHLRLENARLKEELERLSCMAPRYGGGRPMHHPAPSLGPAPPPMMLPSLDLDMGVYSRHFGDLHSDIISLSPPPMTSVPYQTHFSDDIGGSFVRDLDKPIVLELAVSSADQLVRMCRTNEPLWVRNSSGDKLDLEEYRRIFPAWSNNKQEQQMEKVFRVESTRDNGHVMMNSITLVEAFLDVSKWMELFPSIVSNAKTLQVITPGISASGNGSLQLMYAEFQVLSPLVPTRETCFFRYCHHNIEDGYWVIVDFPADGFQEGYHQPTGSVHYKRRPSGFIFQDMPNGYSMVTWVEHVEIEDRGVHHIFDEYIGNGLAFGASRWVAVLQHQCNRLASLMARNVSDLGVIPSPKARKNMMKLSQRMIRTFCSNLSSYESGHPWTALSDSSNDTIRIKTRKNTEPGQPNGVILTSVSTTWMPFSHLQVFELLTDEQRRSQLDILSSGSSLHEVAHIANGSHQKNCVSLFRINASSNSSQNVELMLQESNTHPTGGSLVVYTTIDVDAVQVAMSGEDPSYIPLLPAGFVVIPATPPSNYTGPESNSTNGCLLTVGLQVLASAVSTAKLNLSSVTAINNHLCNVVNQIITALGGSSMHADSSAVATASLTEH